ncbi:hypothetical protein P261_01432 [Lachnospiraceae bacterium TWA4]|nr:hypothetical protein P261_01432 [Lachnospiraceae bacterium TWA4]
MSFRKILYTDLSRAFYPRTILLSAIGCLCSLFFVVGSNGGYYDYTYGYIYEYLEVAFACNEVYLLYLFAAIPYTGSFLVDNKNHYAYFVRVRLKRRYYLLSKVIAVFCSGFVTVALGCLFYFLFLCVKLPNGLSIQTTEFFTDSYLLLLANGHPVIYYMVIISLQALAGGTFCVFAFCFSAVVHSIYAVWSFPVLFCYVWMCLDNMVHFPIYIAITHVTYFPITDDNPLISYGYCWFFFSLLMIGCCLESFPWMERRMRSE